MLRVVTLVVWNLMIFWGGILESEILKILNPDKFTRDSNLFHSRTVVETVPSRSTFSSGSGGTSLFSLPGIVANLKPGNCPCPVLVPEVPNEGMSE